MDMTWLSQSRIHRNCINPVGPQANQNTVLDAVNYLHEPHLTDDILEIDHFCEKDYHSS